MGGTLDYSQIFTVVKNAATTVKENIYSFHIFNYFPKIDSSEKYWIKGEGNKHF